MLLISKRGGIIMFMVLYAILISLWITSLVAFGKSYIRYHKEERAYEESHRVDSWSAECFTVENWVILVDGGISVCVSC